jgi:homoserine dehydrogenase
MDVVLANKGPLVANFERLHQLAKENRRHLKYSATVVWRSPSDKCDSERLVGRKNSSFRGIFNATTNFIFE